MKEETKQKLKDAMEYCEKYDRSIEYMIQYMQDYASVSHDTVMDFLYKESQKEKSK